MTIAERLVAKLKADPVSGCHVWTGGVVGGGYGQMYTGGRGDKSYVHRVAYELANGEIPPGLVIDHICRNRLCCNPAHLRAVTQRVNATENSTGLAALNVAKTHCKSGHALADTNLSRTTSYRECKECKRLRQAAWSAKNRSGSTK